MQSGSKRGAALAYVIIVSAALLILAAGLVSVAQANLNAAQNSLEGRQAYLDAKSAIEYGKAYLQGNPSSGDFTVVKDNTTALGFRMWKTGDPEKIKVADYVSKDHVIKATGKYKSSDTRVRKLGYRFTVSKTDDLDNSTHFIVAGDGYGSHKVLNYYSYGTVDDATSDYPVICRTHQQTTGANSLTAPRIFILGKNGDNSIIIYDSHSLTFKADFIYLAGGINSYNFDPVYPNQPGAPHFYYPLYLKTFSDKAVGVIYFGENIIKNGIVIAKGGQYYYFKNNINLYDLNVGDLTEVNTTDLPANIKTNADFITTNKNSIFSGDGWDKCQGTQWAIDGALKNGLCSIDQGGGGYIWVFNNLCSGFEKQVYLYVNDCSGWGENNIWRQNKAQYIAKEINLQYVNSHPFIIPSSKDVVFKANVISINTQTDDEDSSTTRPHIVQGDKNTLFHLTSLTGGNVTVNIISDLTVDCADSSKSTFTIPSGTYSVASGSNFFNPDIWKAGSGSSSSTSGSSGGGISLTGGGYTNG